MELEFDFACYIASYLVQSLACGLRAQIITRLISQQCSN